jgi:Bacterial extracellular solute-binding protein/von Willebrand factor type A domain
MPSARLMTHRPPPWARLDGMETFMAKHRAGAGIHRWVAAIVGVVAVSVLIVAAVLIAIWDGRSGQPDEAASTSCARTLRVVTATSFAPVLSAVAPVLDRDADCVHLEVTTADGRAAVQRVADTRADLWVPDDGSWVGTAGSLSLVQAPAAHAGSVLATSPFYMVTDGATGARITKAGGGWLGLAHLVEDRSVRLAVRDPQGSGDGMVGAGAGAEAVWLDKDMDASALWLANAQKTTRIVTDGSPALPKTAGEVGIVPEYALLPTLGTTGKDLVTLPGTDHTAMLRYTWLPTASGVAKPDRAAALERLRRELTGQSAQAYMRTADLRTPGASQAADGSVPAPTAKPLDLLAPHHVDHIFATWYPEDRRTNLLVVVDVSGSMAAHTAGSKETRIALVRQGCQTLNGLLPNDSRMGLWEFGSKLDGARDYRSLLGMADLDSNHRRSLTAAIGQLAAQQTGTGLYDTILAAYTSARDAYQPGVPNQVLIFTDGRNEADENSLTAAQLSAALGRTADPKRPVLLSVVTFGKAADANAVDNALKPVTGYVDRLATAQEVAAVFIHVAAGGLHH